MTRKVGVREVMWPLLLLLVPLLVTLLVPLVDGLVRERLGRIVPGTIVIRERPEWHRIRLVSGELVMGERRSPDICLDVVLAERCSPLAAYPYLALRWYLYKLRY